MFGVTPKDLKDILECLSYTFEQSAFTSTSPEDLHTVLISGGFDEAHARVRVIFQSFLSQTITDVEIIQGCERYLVG